MFEMCKVAGISLENLISHYQKQLVSRNNEKMLQQKHAFIVFFRKWLVSPYEISWKAFYQ